MVYKKKGNSYFIKRRGEYPHEVEINKYKFFHSLLPITGEPSPQPYVDKDIVLVYNGEIYNHKFKKSDGEVLIPLYKKYGYNFVKKLDGEWAIALYDFKKGIVLFSTDIFGTKPLWVNGTECSSYESGVGGKKMKANTVIVKNIKNRKIIHKGIVHKFSFRQYKDNYDDWIKAFERAVKKRATDWCFLGLSSGYDSGAINCALKKLKVNFTSYSIVNNEHFSTLIERNPSEFFEIDKDNYLRIWDDIICHSEDYKYKRASGSVLRDPASVGLAMICEKARNKGQKVYLSGQGADEIIGDYKFWPVQNDFNGVFPKKLKEWTNFFGGTQEDYLMKEEYIAGSYAVETRYPFLDKDVVQEFLWLKQDLKNKNYKAPIFEYLTKNNVPFDKEVKRGFNPLKR